MATHPSFGSLTRMRRSGRVARFSVMVLATFAVGTALAAGLEGHNRNAFPGTWAMSPESTNTAVNNCCQGAAPVLPLMPKYRSIRDAYAPQDTVNAIDNLKFCASSGVPGTFQHPLLFEFLFTPGRVNLIFQDGSYRRIWVDGRSFPKDLMPNLQGFSIGHWKGDTLVVETRGLSRRSEILMSGPITATPQTRVVEEISLVRKDRLRVRMTVEDPEIFKSPYIFDAYYTQVPLLFDVSCAADNRDNGDGKIDLSLPTE